MKLSDSLKDGKERTILWYGGYRWEVVSENPVYTKLQMIEEDVEKWERDNAGQRWGLDPRVSPPEVYYMEYGVDINEELKKRFTAFSRED